MVGFIQSMYWVRLLGILLVFISVTNLSAQPTGSDQPNDIDIENRLDGLVLKFGLGAWPAFMSFANMFARSSIVETTMGHLELEHVVYRNQEYTMTQSISTAYNFTCEERIDVSGGATNQSIHEQADDEIYTCHHGPHFITHTRLYFNTEPNSALYIGPSLGIYSYRFIGSQWFARTLGIKNEKTGTRFSYGMNAGFAWVPPELSYGYLDFGLYYMYTTPESFEYAVNKKDKIVHRGRYNGGLNIVAVLVSFVMPLSF